ncbi:MAG: OadG family protein [Candidatus Marinimicrobia bacterium]|nr:OadG family protein [Candidatus Neomarinimicrobiota bacterium]
MIALFGIIIVMISLVVIYFFMQFVTWVIKYLKYRQLKTVRKKKNKLRMIKIEDNCPDMKTVLAISTAIHMEMKYKMEEENAILTINKLIRPYSPWSSKILSMRKVPDRR